MTLDDPALLLLQRFAGSGLLPLLRDDHTYPDVNHALLDWEQPEVSGDYSFDEVNLNWPLPPLESADVLPVFSVSATVVIIIPHWLAVNTFD